MLNSMYSHKPSIVFDLIMLRFHSFLREHECLRCRAPTLMAIPTPSGKKSHQHQHATGGGEKKCVRITKVTRIHPL